MKIDVEGFEQQVINGMKNTLNNVKPKLIIEVHPDLMKPYNSKEPVKELYSQIEHYNYRGYIVENYREEKDVELVPIDPKNILSKTHICFFEPII